MQYIILAAFAAAVFGICYLIDKGFKKLFRNQVQHQSGLAVKANKRYGIFGVILSLLGIVGIINGVAGETVLLVGGIIVLLMGIALGIYYISFGIYYDDDSFLLSSFGKKNVTYRYQSIKTQQIYLVSGNTLVELHMDDGKNISLQAGMIGVYPFLDKAFAGWCRQKGIREEDCAFHDPSNHCWFPPMEES